MKTRIILLPNDRAKIFWNLVLISLLLYTATIMPYRVAFFEELNPSLGLRIFDATVDILFALDMIVNFISAYEDAEMKVIIDPWKIAKQYMKFWFWADMFACIPFQMFIGSSQRSGGYNKLV